jgi:hypothetical protein
VRSYFLRFQPQISSLSKEYHVDVNRDPYKHKPRLTFRADGTFKVTVFSDLHFGENPEGPWGPAQDTNSTRLMTNVLRDEKPDYVCVLVLTLFAEAPDRICVGIVL